MYELDIDAAINEQLKQAGAGGDVFAKIDALISAYSSQSGMPEEGVAMIVLDSLSSGCTAEQIVIQLQVYDSKSPLRRLNGH